MVSITMPLNTDEHVIPSALLDRVSMCDVTIGRNVHILTDEQKHIHTRPVFMGMDYM